MIKIKYHSWDDITLSLSDKLEEALKTPSPIEKNIKIIALLTDSTYEEINALSLIEIVRLTKDIKFVKQPLKLPSKTPKTITLGGMTFRVCLKPSMLNFAQFVDLQSALTQQPIDKLNLVSAILVPEEKVYNTEYDMDEIQEIIRNNLSIVYFQFFFLKSLLLLRKQLKDGMKSFLKVSKKMKMKEKTEKIQEVIRYLR